MSGQVQLSCMTYDLNALLTMFEDARLKRPGCWGGYREVTFDLKVPAELEDVTTKWIG